MVIDKDLKPMHQLTELGEQRYHVLLEAIADDILMKHQHPFKWAMLKAKDFLAEYK